MVLWKGHAMRRGGWGGPPGATTWRLTQREPGVLPSGETVFQAEDAAEAKTLMGDLTLTSSIRNRKKVAVARAA